MAQHRLDPAPSTVVDVFSRDHSPVLEVNPGDSVVVRSLDASGYLSPQQKPGDPQPTMFPEFRGHCLTGPIRVSDAEPGMMLSVHFASLEPDHWGWTIAAQLDNALNRRLGVTDGPPSWSLWDLDVGAGTATNDLGFTRRLSPFLGVAGVAPAAPGEHRTIPPRAEGGGNIDCRELGVGSTLYLPVMVSGALLSVGDGHAAQGDGEVGGTAIECAMTTEMVVDLAEDRPVTSIHAVTPNAKITFGFDPDLNAAMADALDAMLTWMGALYGLERRDALALASTSVDMRVTQVANEVWGVHAVLADDVFLSTPPS